MAISNLNRLVGPFIGNGVTTAFAFNFKVFSAADLQVIRVDAVGGETVLSLTTHYSVTLNADQNAAPGGTVTLLIAPAASFSLYIASAVAFTQPLSLSNQGGFYPAVINDALDRAAIQSQQLALTAQKSLKFALSDAASNITLPTLASLKGNVLAFDAVTGNAIVGPNIGATAAGAAALNNAQQVALQSAASATAAEVSRQATVTLQAAVAANVTTATNAATAANNSAAASEVSRLAAGVSAAASATSATNAAALVSGLASGTLGYATVALMNADLAHPAGTIALVTNDPVTSNNTYYLKSGASGAGAWTVSNNVINASLNTALGFNALQAAAITDTHGVEVLRRTPNTPISWTFSSNFTQFCAGWSSLISQPIDFVQFDLDGVGAAANLVLTVYKRAISSAYTGAPSVGSGDVLLQTISYPTTQFQPGTAAQTVRLPFAQIQTDPGFIYLFAIAANNGAGTAVAIGSANATVAANQPQYVCGYFTIGAGAWQVIATTGTNAISMVAGVSNILPVASTSLVSGSMAGFRSKVVPIPGTSSGNVASPNIFTGVAWTSVVSSALFPTSTRMDGVRAKLYGTHLATKVQLTVWSRAVGSANTAAPSSAGGDLFEARVLQTLTADEIAEGLTGRTLNVMLSSPIQTDISRIYLFEFKLFNAANTAVGIGISYDTNAATLAQWQRGYFFSGTPQNVVSPTIFVATPITNAFIQDVGRGVSRSARALKTSISGLNVAITGTIVRNGRVFPVSVNTLHTAAPVGTDTARVVNMWYSANWQQGYCTNLTRRHISAFSAINTATAVPLVLGTDYAIDAFAGGLQGLINVAAYNVTCTFNWQQERYDMIVLDRQSLAPSIIVGTPRNQDAGEYQPVATAGTIPLAMVLVIGGVVQQVIPLTNDDAVPIGAEDEWVRLRSYNQNALRNTLRKLNRGTAITFGGYGDSITALQGGVVPPFAPDGPARDLINYFAPMPADTIAAIPVYDFGDGAGAVHVKAGWNWILKAYLDSKYAVATVYKNFGIAGTTSTSAAGGGADPSRLAALLAVPMDLVVICFGMNETGAATTYTNMVSIINQIKAAGMDVLVMGMPRTNTMEQHDSVDKWAYTNNELEAAARATGAGWFPTELICSDDFLGMMGLSSLNMTSCNHLNHPGPQEFRQYGKWLGRVFA